MSATESKAFKILKNKNIDPADRHGINLKKYLPLFLKKNSKISQNLLNSLNLDLANDKLDELLERYDGGCAFRYDATFYFILWYTYKEYKTGICLLGFKIRGDKLFVVQIQGLRIDYDFFCNRNNEDIKKTLKLIMSSLKWERLLVKIAEDWARKMGFRKIGILQAKHNEYFRKDPTVEWAIARNNRLKMRYDVTAERMGYKKKPSSRYRSKSL
ncbi:MAG: hypothetical protein HYT63_01480 [Candidatus Yanofskybacteria bacterium]|nr:hypothetical protein [Candidatus Yanofskybacteria bacterium]